MGASWPHIARGGGWAFHLLAGPVQRGKYLPNPQLEVAAAEHEAPRIAITAAATIAFCSAAGCFVVEVAVEVVAEQRGSRAHHARVRVNATQQVLDAGRT